jgi:hypothetical protein
MENILKLITDFEFCEDEAQASVFSKNKNVSHAKFVFTDDLPNANKQRVPQEEFDNIIATGTFMPIKMSAGKINDGHEESVPLGVISHLKQDGNKVIGLATLWLAERTEDINHLKEMVKENKSPQLSWELLYTNSTKNDDGIEDLHDIVVRASTIVGLPAYSGRTPILAISSKAENNSEEIKVEEELKARIAELETELTTLKEALSQKDTELVSLKEFKSAIELKEAEEQKIASIKTKFGEAKISKPDEYFTENREQLLKLDETSLDFMIQELIAYSTVTTTQASGRKPDLPQLPASDTEVKFNTTKEIADALKEQLAKK